MYTWNIFWLVSLPVNSFNYLFKISSSIMEGEQSLRRFSPEVMVQDPNIRNAISLLPPIILFHGTADYSIPSDDRFESALDLILWLHLIIFSSHGAWGLLGCWYKFYYWHSCFKVIVLHGVKLSKTLLSFERCSCPPDLVRSDHNFSSIGVYPSGLLNGYKDSSSKYKLLY